MFKGQTLVGTSRVLPSTDPGVIPWKRNLFKIFTQDYFLFSQKLKQFHWQIFNLCEGECGLDLEGDELGPLLDHQLQLLGVAHLQVFYCDDSAHCSHKKAPPPLSSSNNKANQTLSTFALVQLKNVQIVQWWKWSHPLPVCLKDQISRSEQALPLNEGVDDDSRHNHLKSHKSWRISKTSISFQVPHLNLSMIRFS